MGGGVSDGVGGAELCEWEREREGRECGNVGFAGVSSSMPTTPSAGPEPTGRIGGGTPARNKLGCDNSGKIILAPTPASLRENNLARRNAPREFTNARIIAERRRGQGKQYQVLWDGGDLNDSTWLSGTALKVKGSIALAKWEKQKQLILRSNQQSGEILLSGQRAYAYTCDRNSKGVTESKRLVPAHGLLGGRSNRVTGVMIVLTKGESKSGPWDYPAFGAAASDHSFLSHVGLPPSGGKETLSGSTSTSNKAPSSKGMEVNKYGVSSSGKFDFHRERKVYAPVNQGQFDSSWTSAQSEKFNCCLVQNLKAAMDISAGLRSFSKEWNNSETVAEDRWLMSTEQSSPQSLKHISAADAKPPQIARQPERSGRGNLAASIWCRGVICIKSCPEAEVEGPEADIADLEDITIVEDPGVDVESPEANVQSDTCIKTSSEGQMPEIYGTGNQIAG
ncbi:hypothetical protein B0H14DRAFT_2600003 [Mycena olivaceomarginata]|nr:hypothetical protein B0H14DRAFT_2600003 [Mycena olivaceomarginata]